MPKKSGTTRQKLPVVRTDRAAASMVADGDLTRYDLAGLKPVRFEFAPKSARLNMRLPEDLLMAVKVFCDGVSFVAASRPGGTLAGAVMAIGAGIEKLSKDTRFQIRSPASPMMPVMAPEGTRTR